MLRAVMVLVLLGIPLLASPEARAGANDAIPPPLYLVMDTSGSMGDGDPESKLQAAQRAAYAIIHDLPPGQTVTLVSYPGNFTFRPIEGCSTGDIRFGPAVADKTKLAAEVRSMVALGGTPTGPTLQAIGRTFQASGAASGTVMLLSDGEANCGTTDVCTVAKDLRSKGLSLTVNTVAFDLSDAGAKELECIAHATGGKALRVDQDGNLTEAMTIAAGAKLDVAVHAPPTVESVTGQRDVGSANLVDVVVSSTGSAPARDVRVSLSISDGSGQPGAVYVPKPVRHLGTLGGGVSRASVTFQPRPVAGTPGPLRWKVTVTSGGATPLNVEGAFELTDSTKLSSAGPLLTEAKHVVILGDSYSSGEGGADYDGDDDRASGEYLCHRSKNAYGRLLYSSSADAPFGPSAARLTMLACSGAVSRELITYQHIWDIKPQLTELRVLAHSATPPDLVLLTLGGNDANFAEFIKACVTTGVVADGRSLLTWFPCQSDPASQQTPDVENYLVTKTLVSNLVARYRDIDAVLNAPDVTARRGGRVAQIVVLPYVNPLPPVERVRGGCFLGLSTYEIDMAEDLFRKVNGAVSSAVALSQAEGIPLRLVEPIVDAFQDGHTICDDPSAIRVDTVLWKKALESNPFDSHRYTQELMHPSAFGYRLEAQTLIEWSRGQSANWDIPHRPTQEGLELETPYEVTVRRATPADGSLIFQAGPRFPEPGDALPATCTGLFGQDVCETVTKTKLRMVHVESSPRFIGAAWSSDGTEWLGDMALPADLAPGEHTVVMYALADDGTVTRASATIRVFPPGTRASVILLALGLLLVAGGGARLIFLKRRRTQSSNAPDIGPK
jgi:lysophospholipase L1-like esterase